MGGTPPKRRGGGWPWAAARPPTPQPQRGGVVVGRSVGRRPRQRPPSSPTTNPRRRRPSIAPLSPFYPGTMPIAAAAAPAAQLFRRRGHTHTRAVAIVLLWPSRFGHDTPHPNAFRLNNATTSRFFLHASVYPTRVCTFGF